MADDLRFRGRFRIPSARYPGWDYRWAGVYSVTICTHGRVRCLGEVVDGQVSLSPLGSVVAEEWLKIPHHHPRVKLDEWIVMPDHMHGILIFHGSIPVDGHRDSKYLKSQSLGAVIGKFKGDATKRIWWNLRQRAFRWQPRFHDDIVRNPTQLANLRAYIRDNPKRWEP
jgi:REP element-mobilizing transposase RayT